MIEYDETNREISIKYNESLRNGDYRTAVMCLDVLIQIAKAEKRHNYTTILRSIRSVIARTYCIDIE